MATLQSTNVNGTLCVNGVAIGGGKDYNYCCISSSQQFTPTSDLATGDKYITATLIGGGGGGGGSFGKVNGCTHGWGNTHGSNLNLGGGAGGAGTTQYDAFVPITSTDACCVSIGAGGVGGVAFENTTNVACGPEDPGGVYCAAADGGDTTFGGFAGAGGSAGFACYRCAKLGFGGANTSYCVDGGAYPNAPTHEYSVFNTCDRDISTRKTVTNNSIWGNVTHDQSTGSFFKGPFQYGRSSTANCIAFYDTDGARIHAITGGQENGAFGSFGGYCQATECKANLLNNYSSSLISGSTNGFRTGGPRENAEFLLGGAICIVNSAVSYSFNIEDSNVTASQWYTGSDIGVMGSGGKNGNMLFKVCASGAPSAQTAYVSGSGRGANGVDGIAILKWYE